MYSINWLKVMMNGNGYRLKIGTICLQTGMQDRYRLGGRCFPCGELGLGLNYHNPQQWNDRGMPNPSRWNSPAPWEWESRSLTPVVLPFSSLWILVIVLFGFGFIEVSFSANLLKRNGILEPAERNTAGQFWRNFFVTNVAPAVSLLQNCWKV